MKFKEKYLAGEIELEEIDDFVSEWNQSDDLQTLASYLGLNEEEEAAWIDIGEEALFDMLESEKADRR